MNQLYHPARTASFFEMLAQNSNIPAFTVTNNAVHDLMTFADAEKKQKTLEGVAKFLKANRYEPLLLSDLFKEFVLSCSCREIVISLLLQGKDKLLTHELWWQARW